MLGFIGGTDLLVTFFFFFIIKRIFQYVVNKFKGYYFSDIEYNSPSPYEKLGYILFIKPGRSQTDPNTFFGNMNMVLFQMDTVIGKYAKNDQVHLLRQVWVFCSIFEIRLFLYKLENWCFEFYIVPRLTIYEKNIFSYKFRCVFNEFDNNFPHTSVVKSTSFNKFRNNNFK